MSICIVLSHTKENVRGGNTGGIMMFSANWKNSLKLTAVSALLFPLHLPRMAPREDLCNTHRVKCSTACIWQAEFDTQCAECQFVKYPKWGICWATPRHTKVTSSRYPARYWPTHPIITECLTLILSCQVSLPPQFRKCLLGYSNSTANLYHQQKWCWYSSSTLRRQRIGPWLLLCSQNQCCSLPQH